MVVQGTTLMSISPTNDFRIRWILQDEFLNKMIKNRYFCGRMLVDTVDTNLPYDYQALPSSKTQ